MKKFNSNDIRTIWKDFFIEKNHLYLKSKKLIPENDNSLLWINSGVATLKDYFSGVQNPPSKRLISIQKCIRTSDLEKIGWSQRHHTLFEMLGNFSIGDYFKKEAIEYGYELLFNEKYFNIPKEKIYITVFHDDLETKNEWINLGVDENHIFLMGKKTNFWDLGVGPCGPSTEIFFDRGEKFDRRSAEDLIKGDIDNSRYIEIWNIVFSQFNNDGNNNYTPLKQKNIDTGAGLERLAMIFQDVPTDYETDLFLPLIEIISKYSAKKYTYDYIPGKLSEDKELVNHHYKCIVDFIRTIVFSISDGAEISNNGSGYVIKRLIRKIFIYSHYLEIKENFTKELVEKIIEIMGDWYNEIVSKKLEIIEIFKVQMTLFESSIKSAEKLFYRTLNKEKFKVLDPGFAFKLHETYGLPIEIILSLAKINSLKFEINEFNLLNEKFKEQSRQNLDQSDIFKEQTTEFTSIPRTIFLGYDQTFPMRAKLLELHEYQDYYLLAFDKTIFYATSGGQEFDLGKISNSLVIEVTKNKDGIYIHKVEKRDDFKVGNEYELSIDLERRNNLSINHSTAHLLFKSIETVIGSKIKQNGSKITSNSGRFDFQLSKGEIQKEQIIDAIYLTNKIIDEDIEQVTKIISFEDAKKIGATFLPSKSYSKDVRVVSFGDFTSDMCAGTHVKSTGVIEKIDVIDFQPKGKNIYRLEFICGNDVIHKFKNNYINENINNFIYKTKKISEEIDTFLIPFLLKYEISVSKNGIADNINSKILNLDTSMFLKEYFLEMKSSLKSSIVDKEKSIFTLIKKYTTSFSKKLIDYINSNNLVNIQLVNENINKFIDFRNIAIKCLESTITENKLIIMDYEKKSTLIFLISSDNLDKYNRSYITNIVNSFKTIKGGGNNSMYQFNGDVSEIHSLCDGLSM